MPTTSSTDKIYYSLSDLNDALTKTNYDVPFYYKNSQKSYKIVKDWKTFKDTYKSTNKNNGCAEFIRENQPTKMYFDVDYYAEEDDNTMLNNVIEFLEYSINDILVKALALAQQMNPKTNASWVNGKIIKYKSVDVSIAVALDEGLITPIVKKADLKGLFKISNEIKELVKKAKKGKLLPEEYNGGTITISK